jgi:hypothetical protein
MYDSLPECIKRLSNIEKPSKIRLKLWVSIQREIRILNKPDNTNLAKLSHPQWSILDILGCHKTNPHQRYDCMGLFMLTEGRTIHDVQEDGIILRTRSGALQKYGKKIWMPSDMINILDLDEN